MNNTASETIVDTSNTMGVGSFCPRWTKESNMDLLERCYQMLSMIDDACKLIEFLDDDELQELYDLQEELRDIVE